ncbi:MAG: hypothetical protein KJ718_03570 [Nanoarchaeota archaeon]|nr:hypothetical protein [Nanoarchaeota archaeon]MBU1051609.1 hypothetical protein [Nanoarchaeota archaeon]MBU1988088.1 hypothetical protein [Nanoarchaeota archaeon]
MIQKKTILFVIVLFIIIAIFIALQKDVLFSPLNLKKISKPPSLESYQKFCRNPLPIYSTTIPDPSGDAPAHIDILSTEIGSINNKIQFVMELEEEPIGADDTIYIWFIDTDFNAQTGQQHGQIGSEYNLRIYYYNGQWDAAIDDINNQESWPAPFFIDNKRLILSAPRNKIGESEGFDFYFESNYQNQQFDDGSYGTYDFIENNNWDFVFNIGNEVFPERLQKKSIYIPKQDSVPISLVAKRNGLEEEVDRRLIEFFPESSNIIDIINFEITDISTEYSDLLGHEEFNLGAYLRDCDVITNEKINIFIGDLYQGDNIAFIIPGKFKCPESSSDCGAQEWQHSFDEILTSFNTIYVTDLNYNLQLHLTGISPIEGQPLLYEFNYDLCGGAGELIGLGWGCINYNDMPDWFVLYHETGHIFQKHIFDDPHFIGMQDLIIEDDSLFSEGMATLGEMYTINTLTSGTVIYDIDEPELSSIIDEINIQYGFLNSTDCQGHSNGDNCFTSLWAYENVFGSNISLIDPNILDGIFLQLAEEFSWEIYPRFYKVFLPEFQSDYAPVEIGQGETFFIAALSAAAGQDLRPQFREWNFPINEDYFDQIYPVLLNIINS